MNPIDRFGSVPSNGRMPSVFGGIQIRGNPRKSAAKDPDSVCANLRVPVGPKARNKRGARCPSAARSAGDAHFSFPIPNFTFSQSAFSLIELLVVISIIAIMASLTVPAVGGAARRAKFNKAISAIAAEMELAQQAAVAGSTYTWVAFANQSNAPVMVSARSLEGANPTNLSIDLVTPTTAQQLGKAQTLEGVVLANTLPNSSTNFPAEESTATVPNPSGGVTITAKAGGTNTTFNWAVEFNPMGEARVRTATGAGGSTAADHIKLVVIPSADGTPKETENATASLIWINGTSGGTEVIQP